MFNCYLNRNVLRSSRLQHEKEINDQTKHQIGNAIGKTSTWRLFCTARGGKDGLGGLHEPQCADYF